MSVLFLPSPSAASIPDASETVSGKIRIATSAEATTGTNDLTAMTPAKVKTVVDAAVVGGVTYKGTFDTSAPVDLSNALQGDLYIISVAGSYQGQTWAVGDHLLINADMGGTLDPAKIDKVDNTDAVTSVAGRTGAVVLSSADISGLATVATSGAYSDLSGTPTLATVATTGAYSDLSGTPTLATVATTGAYSDLSGTPTLGTAAAEDVGTSANNVVQLNGSAQLPAVDGSLLTNISATVAALDDVGDVTITGVSNTQVIKYNSTSGEWENGAVAYSEVTGTPSLATVATTGAYSDLTGTPSLATVATTGAYSDLTGTPTLGTAAAEDVGTSAGNVVQLNGSAQLPAVDGSLLTNVSASVAALDDVGDVTITGVANTQVIKYNSTSGDWENGAVAYSEVTGTPTLATVATTGAYSDLSGTPTLGTAAAEDVGTSANNVVQLNGSAQLPAVDGSLLTNVSASVAALDDVGDVAITGVANTQVIKYNSTSGDWENGAVAYADVTGTPSLATVATSGAYSDLSGTPTLATVATSGAYSDLTGTPTLATVATSGAYSDLTGTPTLGTAAAEDVGTSANNVVQLDGTAKLPAVDGSQLTSLPTAGYPSLTSASPSSTYTISTSSGFMEIYLLNPTAAITVNIPAPSSVSNGYRYNIKNTSANSITVTPASGNIDGASTLVLNVQYSAVTLVSDQTNWFII